MYRRSIGRRQNSESPVATTGQILVMGTIGVFVGLVLGLMFFASWLWAVLFFAPILMLGIARWRMKRVVKRLARRATPRRIERVQPGGWTSPGPLRISEHHATGGPAPATPDGVAVLFLWVFDRAATWPLLHRMTQLGPVYLLRGGGMLAYELTDMPRMVFGRIDRFVEETEDEVVEKLSKFRVRRTLGYYRTCSMVCTDDVWQFALDRLLERCRVIVVDLSDFVAGRAGIAYEIGLLLDRVPLDQIVFVCGPATDRVALSSLLQGVWDTLAVDSPNRQRSAEVQLAITTALDDDASNNRSPATANDLNLIVGLVGQAAVRNPRKPLPPPLPN